MRYTNQLRQQMQRAGLTSLKALYQAAGVSKGAVMRLRQGHIGRMQLDTLLRLSHALKLSLAALVAQFSEAAAGGDRVEDSASRDLVPAVPSAVASSAPTAPEARENSARLEQWQRTSLQILEPWLLQWPTAVYAVQANETLPATRLLPLVAPINRLIESWEVSPIGQVGQQAIYDPQLHQPMSGPIQPGDPVRIRYVGYRHADRLLHRAKASRI